MMCTFLSATKCLKGVVICPFEKEGGFQVFCDYTSGCEDMGCNYIITGEDMTYITGTISPNSFSHLSISIHSYNSITVNNKYHSVRHPLLINSIRSCLKSKPF